MEKNEIKTKLISFIEEKAGISLHADITDSRCSLLDPKMGIEPRDLLMIVIEMQRLYKISLKEEDVLNNRMDYLNNMVDWIYESVSEKAEE